MIHIENIGDYLVSNDIKPSYQRMRVFEYLTAKHNHPTVDKIYTELVGDIPTLSKTTVYNTLKLFIDKGIVKVVNIEDNEVRYDADTSLHGHFKCEQCDLIYDFKIDPSNIDYGEVKNFKINETHLYIKGVCDNCKSN